MIESTSITARTDSRALRQRASCRSRVSRQQPAARGHWQRGRRLPCSFRGLAQVYLAICAVRRAIPSRRAAAQDIAERRG